MADHCSPTPGTAQERLGRGAERSRVLGSEAFPAQLHTQISAEGPAAWRLVSSSFSLLFSSLSGWEAVSTPRGYLAKSGCVFILITRDSLVSRGQDAKHTVLSRPTNVGQVDGTIVLPDQKPH